MSDTIVVDSVSKKFIIQSFRANTFKEYVIRRIKKDHDPGKEFWALKDVSFSIQSGKTLGIIGHNGAGKSTLLRLICGLGRPTKGEIITYGRVSALLELGSGFHLDLTGRENILTVGILNGYTAEQVKEKEKEIIKFSELENFIDQPLRTFSNGMFLRLAFSSAIHFEPEIIVIDEILAVGDISFQQKCIRKLTNLKSLAKSLIITSHDTDQIKNLCDEILVLEDGKVVTIDIPDKAIKCYHDIMVRRTERRAKEIAKDYKSTEAENNEGSRIGTLEAIIEDVSLYDASGKQVEKLTKNDPLRIDINYKINNENIEDLILLLSIINSQSVNCFETHIHSVKNTFGVLKKSGAVSCYFPNMNLLPGCYNVVVGLYPTNWEVTYDYHWNMYEFYIDGYDGYPHYRTGVMALSPEWSVLTDKSIK